MRVALLEDDDAIADFVMRGLIEHGHSCERFNSGKKLLEKLQTEGFDLCLLDWIIPDVGGDEVLSWIRLRQGSDVPVIFISQRDSEEDVIAMLNAGADDYLAKPISFPLLIARMSAVQRRKAPDADADVIHSARLTVDLARREISLDGRAVDLTSREQELALCLFQNLGRLITRSHLQSVLWSGRADASNRALDVHVSRVRSKLALFAEHGWRLSSIYGQGYRLERLDEAN